MLLNEVLVKENLLESMKHNIWAVNIYILGTNPPLLPSVKPKSPATKLEMQF